MIKQPKFQIGDSFTFNDDETIYIINSISDTYYITTQEKTEDKVLFVFDDENSMTGELKMINKLKNAIDSNNQKEAYNLLLSANNLYYNNGTSPLTDEEFDLFQKLYEKQFHTEFKTGYKSPGRKDRQANVQHDYPLLSNWLNKVATIDEVFPWLTKLSETNDFIISPKWDGMSIVISYTQSGQVKRALTRGEDGFGVDITRLFQDEIHYDPEYFDDEFGVKYEAIMSWSDVDQLGIDYNKDYKNPRNTIAGIISSDDISRRNYITLVPLDIELKNKKLSRLDRIGLIAESCIIEGQTETPFYFTKCDQSDILEVYQDYHDLRESEDFDYMLDGIVIEYISEEDIHKLGLSKTSSPNHVMAVKFPSMTGRSFVKSIDFDIGNSGRCTPVVNYDPILLDGRTFKRTSISNLRRFDQLKLCIGTPILVEIRGDVLGYIHRDGDDPENVQPIEIPTGLKFTYNKDHERVFAFTEASLTGRVELLCVKLNMKGIRFETIDKLVQHQLIQKLSDIFTLKRGTIATVPGLGTLSEDLLLSTINEKLKSGLFDWEILAAVGILNIGREICKEALKVISIDQLVDLIKHKEYLPIVQAKIGPERGKMLFQGIKKNIRDIKDLMKLPNMKRTEQKSETLDGFKIVVTGNLEHWPERNVFKDEIEALGHKLVGSISKKVDYLITNTPNSGTIKNQKAIDLGIKIITEEQAIEILKLKFNKDKKTNYTKTDLDSL
jgi:DNA ligase (NAD+)